MWASAFHGHSLCPWAWRQQGTRRAVGVAPWLAREQPASLLTGDSILNLCHIREVGSVGDAQTPHAMSMTPFLEEKQRDHVKHGQLRQLSLHSTTDPPLPKAAALLRYVTDTRLTMPSRAALSQAYEPQILE